MLDRSVIAGSFIASALVVGAPHAVAADQTGSWTVTGKCKRLIVRNEKLTDACTGEVTQTRYADGSVTFRFSDGQNWLIFRGKQAATKLWQEYKIVVGVDGVAFGKVGENLEFVTRVGGAECSFGAPYRGLGTVGCTATVGFQMWAATVETDGRLPMPDSEYIRPTLSKP
ncbi:hypothetical protein [Mesorhizobium sp.]|uniref:hypothetical protein n=1 Tax=Mesorhizobium sp. TaxID=1871066 RepID=UPI000FE41FB8|nr:hypothetical protein [Mesorhizobium sp.]RWH71517.1 MAG: hypothetical protein EOQ84_15655 [Mesorhizobium sp.]RWL30321.1 MAG: hypothetical protein EOR58_08000 [Mesorhizobium sp.]RWL32639.1 MAG: hypothetical protein EOR63_12905 [Mesorhizobium sp.]RWL39352.1 MAG: hypothetical protein EOR59_10535 [Mesorhizobium sp.]RWL55156.1 MAG: hypothetical protein EOR62_09630 [Mesorhizobium sp.]